MGKAIVSTSIGAEGIDISDNENILIANTSNEFITKISQCISQPEVCSAIGDSAMKFVNDKFSTSTTAKELIGFYNKEKQT